MAKAAPYEPPPDPDFEQLAHEGYAAWKRDQPHVVAFDTETTGLAHFDVPFCATVAWRDTQGGSIPIEAHFFEFDRFDGKRMVCDILENSSTIVGHNLKFDLQKALLADIWTSRDALHPRLIEDTQVLAHLLDEHRTRYGLKELAVDVLGYEDLIDVPYASGEKAKQGLTRKMPREKYEIEQAKKWAKKEYGIASVRDVGYHLLPRGVVVPYAVKDALWTLELFELFRPQLAGRSGLLDCYEQEMALTLVLLDMEEAGMRLDLEYVREQIRAYTKRIIQHDIRIAEVVGKPVGKDASAGEFNPASNPQLAEFFRAAGHDHEKYDKSALSKIDHPLAPLLLERRKDEKLLSTYFQAMQKEQADGILHPSYRQNVSTGRMSSGKETG